MREYCFLRATCWDRRESELFRQVHIGHGEGLFRSGSIVGHDSSGAHACSQRLLAEFVYIIFDSSRGVELIAGLDFVLSVHFSPVVDAGWFE